MLVGLSRSDIKILKVTICICTRFSLYDFFFNDLMLSGEHDPTCPDPTAETTTAAPPPPPTTPTTTKKTTKAPGRYLILQ